MSPISKIVVVGSSNTDMLVKAAKIPRPGETVIGGEFRMAGGGKGANQAVAAARAGGDVTFIVRVGDDVFGRQAVEGFRHDGIETRFVFKDKRAASGVALIMVKGRAFGSPLARGYKPRASTAEVDPRAKPGAPAAVDAPGENSIAVASGANAKLTPADVEKAKGVIAAADILLLQLETPLETVSRAAKLACAHGVPVILNPAPARSLDDRLLRSITILTPNEIEAEILTGIKIKSRTDMAEAARKLMARGVKAVLITLGARGVFVADGKTRTIVPAYKVKAVDTTAAGDVFNGALAVALAEGRELLDAARFANAAAALSVTKWGAQPSAPKRKDIERFMA